MLEEKGLKTSWWSRWNLNLVIRTTQDNTEAISKLVKTSPSSPPSPCLPSIAEAIRTLTPSLRSSTGWTSPNLQVHTLSSRIFVLPNPQNHYMGVLFNRTPRPLAVQHISVLSPPGPLCIHPPNSTKVLGIELFQSLQPDFLAKVCRYIELCLDVHCLFLVARSRSAGLWDWPNRGTNKPDTFWRIDGWF